MCQFLVQYLITNITYTLTKKAETVATISAFPVLTYIINFSLLFLPDS